MARPLPDPAEESGAAESPAHSAPAARARAKVNRRRLVVVLAILSLAAAILGVLAAAGSGGALAAARRAGVIRIGYAVEAPYAFLDGNRVTGESPEIARVIAARLGIGRVEWRLAEFGDLIEGLESRRFDAVAAGMFITAERRRRVAFSTPTFQVGPGLLVRGGNPLGLHSYADIVRSAAARVAVLTGSAEEARLVQLACPSGRILRVPDAQAGRTAVDYGHADALALSAPTIRWMAQGPGAGQAEMAEPFSDSAGGTAAAPALGGFAFRKEDRSLLKAWNSELARYIGTEEHLRLVGGFGFTAAELPPPAEARKGGREP